jgi:hypothetical protein
MIQGNCTGDANPDWWFPELPHHRISNVALEVLTKQTRYALQLCSSCPVKDTCLAEGMKKEKMRRDVEGWGNLPFGIWGGTMPHERLEMVGITPNTSTGYAVKQAYALKNQLGQALGR